MIELDQMHTSLEQRQSYAQDGYLYVPGLLADQVAAMSDEADRLLGMEHLIDHRNLRTLPKRDVVTKALVTERFDPLIDVSPLFADIAKHSIVQQVASELLNDEALLFKDKLIFKKPGTVGYNLHQDWNQWKPFATDILSVMVAIDGADADNGALEVVAGMHDHYYDDGQAWQPQQSNQPKRAGEGPRKGSKLMQETMSERACQAQLIQTQPGDCIFFHCLTPHGSGPNTSNRSRRQFYPSYAGARNGDRYLAHYDHVWQLRRREREDSLYFA